MKTQLSAPWWILYRQMSATIGKTPGVVMKDLQEAAPILYLDLECPDPKRAIALNRILVRQYPMGNITVVVRVIRNGQPLPPDNKALTPAELIETLKTALDGNPLFTDAIVANHHPGPDPIGQVVAVFDAKVVQFWCDKLDDYYGNMNMVAAEAFTRELLQNYPGGTLLSFTSKRLTG